MTSQEIEELKNIILDEIEYESNLGVISTALLLSHLVKSKDR